MKPAVVQTLGTRLATGGSLLLIAIAVTRCLGAPEFPIGQPYERPINDEDAAVLKAILFSYMSGEFFGPPPAPPPGTAAAESGRMAERPKPRLVVLQPLTPGGPHYRDFAKEFGRHHHDWRDFDHRRVSVAMPHSALVDFALRNQSPQDLRSFQVPDVPIRYADENREHASLFLSLPGFSLDREVAVLDIQAGYSMTGGGHLFYLRRLGGEWRIIATASTGSADQ